MWTAVLYVELLLKASWQSRLLNYGWHTAIRKLTEYVKARFDCEDRETGAVYSSLLNKMSFELKKERKRILKFPSMPWL